MNANKTRQLEAYNIEFEAEETRKYSTINTTKTYNKCFLLYHGGIPSEREILQMVVDNKIKVLQPHVYGGRGYSWKTSFRITEPSWNGPFANVKLYAEYGDGGDEYEISLRVVKISKV